MKDETGESPHRDELDNTTAEERGYIAFCEFVESLEARHKAGEDLNADELAFMVRGRSKITVDQLGADIEDGKIKNAETIYSSERDRVRSRAHTAAVRRRCQGQDGTWRSTPSVATVACSPTPRARSRGAGRPRARATRSSAKSGDSGSDEPPGSERRCEACGAPIPNHCRADKRTCDDLCRKALSRGKVASPPPVVRQSDRLEDEIEAVAWQRHLAWIAFADVRPSIRGDLDVALADLYTELRRQRAGQPRYEFRGRSASVVTLPAPPLRRPWRTRRREAVVA